MLLVKTRVWVGCSVSLAHKTWSRSFLLKDFPLSGEECCVRTLKTAVWQTNHRPIGCWNKLRVLLSQWLAHLNNKRMFVNSEHRYTKGSEDLLIKCNIISFYDAIFVSAILNFYLTLISIWIYIYRIKSKGLFIQKRFAAQQAELHYRLQYRNENDFG